MDLADFRKRWLLPLLFFQVYLTATVVLFFWGPWPWEVRSPLTLAGYLLLSQVLIAIGYLAAWRQVAWSFDQQEDEHGGGDEGVRVLAWALVASLLLLIPTSLSRTGSVLPDVLGALRDPGAAYNENQRRLSESNPFVLVEYVRMLLSPLLIGVLPLTVVYWRRLSTAVRMVCLGTILAGLSFYIATGTNKGLADFVVTLPWLIYVAAFSRHRKIHVNWWAVGAIATVLLAAFLQFFGAGQALREGGVGEFGVFETGDGKGWLFADDLHPVSQLLSDSNRIIFESLTRYLGQGYYALSMSLELEGGQTLGLGHSMFLARNADAVFATDHFTTASIPAMLEERTGWGVGALWHSIYPWLASDFTFLGALVVLAVFAWLLGLAWGRALLAKDPYWVVFLYLLIILFFYIPANNQVFQTGESCMAFFLLAAILVYRTQRSRSEPERARDLDLQRAHE
jgi:hypothetical protein